METITCQSYAKNGKEFVIVQPGLSSTYLYEGPTDKVPKLLHNKNKVLNIPEARTSFGLDGGIVSTSTALLIFVEAFFTGKLFPLSYNAGLQKRNKIFSPLKSGIGIHLFKLSCIFSRREPYLTLSDTQVFQGH